jgi:hypothetical protein
MTENNNFRLYSGGHRPSYKPGTPAGKRDKRGGGQVSGKQVLRPVVHGMELKAITPLFAKLRKSGAGYPANFFNTTGR